MSTTYTANVGLGTPALSDTGWKTVLDANRAILDALAPVGGLCVSLHETPSSTLNVAVAPGTFRKSDGTFVNYAGSVSQAMTTAATNYVYLTDAGTLTVNTSGFPATLHVRLAVVVAGASTITSIADARVAYHSAGAAASLSLLGGTFSDAGGVITVGLGTTNGVKIGATAGDKLGLWGVTPIVQPSGASQAAVGTLATVALTDSTGGTASTTLAAISDTATKNAVASLAAQHANVLADLGTVKALLNAIRTAMVAAGTMKGSA